MSKISNFTIKEWYQRFLNKCKLLNKFGAVCIGLAIGIKGSEISYNWALAALIGMFGMLIMQAQDLEIGFGRLHREDLSDRDIHILDGAHYRYTGIKAGLINFPVFLIGWLMLALAVVSKI